MFLKLGLGLWYNSVTTIRTSVSLEGDYTISINLFHKVIKPHVGLIQFHVPLTYIKGLAQMSIVSFLS